MKEITTVGIDLAKTLFAVHGVDAVGRTMLRKTVRREQVMELIAALPPCLIGMEACGGAHEWARRFAANQSRRSLRSFRGDLRFSCILSFSRLSRLSRARHLTGVFRGGSYPARPRNR